MTLHWKDLPPYGSSAEALAALEPLGVKLMGETTPTTFYWSEEANGVLQELGTLDFCHSGQIKVWPRKGLSEGMLTTLIVCADVSFRQRPSRSIWLELQAPKGR